MMRYRLRTLLIVLALGLPVVAGVGCGENRPATDNRSQPTDKRGMICLAVSIPVARQFPNSDELTTRDAIIEELEQRQLGESAGSGGGLGQMDFAFNVEDEATARALITEVVEKRLPGVTFKVTRIDPEEQ